MDGNWLFHTFNNLVFGGQLAVEDIRLRIWYFILRNRDTYQNIWEGNLETHIQKIEKKIEFGEQV